jgi:uncharacterized protein YbaR (Trm112 family)
MISKGQSKQSSAAPRKSEILSSELLKVICCPIDKADLIYDRKKQTLTCKKCKFVYPIKKGIPILLPPNIQ